MYFQQPYDTNTGKLVKTNLITNGLLKYITGNNNTDLSYGFPIGGLETIYITGKNAEEANMLTWDFPIFFKDVRSRACVAMNLRPYVVNAKKEFTSLSEISRDKNAITFLMLLAYLSDKCNQDPMYLKPILHNISTGFASIVLSTVSRITVLTAIDRVNLEIACHMYVHNMVYPENDLREDLERLSNFVNKVKLSYPLDKRTITSRIDMILNNANLENKPHSFVLLQALLSGALPEDMKTIVNTEAVCSMLDNGWFGPGSSKGLFIALEYLPMLTTMIYSCVSSSLYKNTKVGQALEGNKRNIGFEDIKQFIFNNVIKKEVGEL